MGQQSEILIKYEIKTFRETTHIISSQHCSVQAVSASF